jgi:DNA helicase-2/ATP-dependent DNA helicase PcrA
LGKVQRAQRGGFAVADYRGLPRERIVEGLNKRQLDAVDTLHGPVLVLAGAGTGKTTVITRRILNLLRSGVRPEQILALTFTRKAAREMYERLSTLLGSEPKGMVLSTFHGFGFRLLRLEGRRVGLNRIPQLVRPDTQGELAKRVLEELDPGREFSVVRLLTVISRAKSHGLTPSALDDQAEDDSSRQLAQAYACYEETLRSGGLVDFDDMIALSVRLLRESEAARLECLRRWPFLLVDEYQDTSRDQYELVKLLLGQSQNICVVGDDDQSIYRFRGAEVANILGFGRDFPRAKVVTLETNYRSTGEVVRLARTIIEGATRRFPKRLVSAIGPVGIPVEFVHVQSAEEEERFVAQAITDLSISGTAFTDIAVLHRVRKGLSAFAECLTRESIPVQYGPSEPDDTTKPRGVRLMTLHAAKGLEFRHVFMPSVEDGTIPHFHSVNEGDDALEEERRLLYVGLTRARQHLVLSASASRRNHRQRPSRFFDEIDAEMMVDVDA